MRSNRLQASAFAVIASVSMGAFAQNGSPATEQHKTHVRYGVLLSTSPGEADVEVIDAKGRPQKIAFIVKQETRFFAVKAGDHVKVVYEGEGSALTAISVNDANAASSNVKTSTLNDVGKVSSVPGTTSTPRTAKSTDSVGRVSKTKHVISPSATSVAASKISNEKHVISPKSTSVAGGKISSEKHVISPKSTEVAANKSGPGPEAPSPVSVGLGDTKVELYAESHTRKPIPVSEAAPVTPDDPNKPPIKIAVLDFKYNDPNGSDKTSLQSNDSPWTELAERVASKLGIGADFKVIHADGQEKVTVSLTQAQAQSGDSEQTTAAKIGALLGVDAVLIGSIEDSLLASAGAGAPDPKDGSRPEKEISLHARLVDTKTGKTLSEVNGVGFTPPMKDGQVSTCDGKKGNKACIDGAAPSQSWTNSTAFKEASSQAIDSLVTGLEDGGTKKSSIGTIFDQDNDTVTVLSKEGAVPAVGSRLVITRSSGLVKDPGTGDVIRPADQTIGYITVQNVDGTLASGKFEATAPNTVTKTGDTVSIAPAK
jgi:hypothetical protein